MNDTLEKTTGPEASKNREFWGHLSQSTLAKVIGALLLAAGSIAVAVVSTK
ncbi:hypothetical protein [Subtercola sp. YIM 133946]|uniref:hypothetical protein n=1 Tax=Subtercola sp. YIM 133946 TaxID=3118909 RepID=UPI002F9372E6